MVVTINTPPPSPGAHPVSSYSIQLCSPLSRIQALHTCYSQLVLFLHVRAPVGALILTATASVSTTHQPKYKLATDYSGLIYTEQ